MDRYQVHYQDNRDSEQMYDYLESRIEVLKQRLRELEMENVTLRCHIEVLEQRLESVNLLEQSTASVVVN